MCFRIYLSTLFFCITSCASRDPIVFRHVCQSVDLLSAEINQARISSINVKRWVGFPFGLTATANLRSNNSAKLTQYEFGFNGNGKLEWFSPVSTLLPDVPLGKDTVKDISIRHRFVVSAKHLSNLLPYQIDWSDVRIHAVSSIFLVTVFNRNHDFEPVITFVMDSECQCLALYRESY